MFKNLISPVQAWLLTQNRCVGCGTELDKGNKKDSQITCKCGRIYISEGKNFRRARLDEVTAKSQK